MDRPFILDLKTGTITGPHALPLLLFLRRSTITGRSIFADRCGVKVQEPTSNRGHVENLLAILLARGCQNHPLRRVICPLIVRRPFILSNFFDFKTGTITGHMRFHEATRANRTDCGTRASKTALVRSVKIRGRFVFVSAPVISAAEQCADRASVSSIRRDTVSALPRSKRCRR